MKKLLALVLALLVALPCIALAEPSTAYTIGLMNPVVSYNGQTLDMTGLDVELSAYVSDIGQIALSLAANAGPNFENNVVTGRAQLDPNGLSFTADGLSNVYTVDLNDMLNTNVSSYLTLLPMIPVNTLLSTPIDMGDYSVDLSLAARYVAVNGFLAPYVSGSTLTIDRTAGELLVNQVLTAIESTAASTNVDVNGIAELRAAGFAFDLNGTMTTTGDPASNNGGYAISGEGQIYAGDETETIPFKLNWNDSTANTDIALEFHEPDGGSEVIRIALNSATTPADGRNANQTVFSMRMEDGADVEEFLNATYTATPVAGSRQMDHVFTLIVPDEDINMTLKFSNGTNGDDIGFSFDTTITDPNSAPINLYLSYTGAKQTDDYGAALTGNLSLGASADGQSAGISTGLLLRSTAMDTTTWAYDSSAAIDVNNMTEMDANTAMIGLMGIAANAFTLVSQHVPGLAPLMQAAMSDMA